MIFKPQKHIWIALPCPEGSMFELALCFLGCLGGYEGALIGRRIGLELTQPYVKTMSDALCRHCQKGTHYDLAREIVFKSVIAKYR